MGKTKKKKMYNNGNKVGTSGNPESSVADRRDKNDTGVFSSTARGRRTPNDYAAIRPRRAVCRSRTPSRHDASHAHRGRRDKSQHGRPARASARERHFRASVCAVSRVSKVERSQLTFSSKNHSSRTRDGH